MFTKQLFVRYCTRVGAVRLYEPKEEEEGGGGGTWMCTLSCGKQVGGLVRHEAVGRPGLVVIRAQGRPL
jgi:hypothetical protein